MTNIASSADLLSSAETVVSATSMPRGLAHDEDMVALLARITRDHQETFSLLQLLGDRLAQGQTQIDHLRAILLDDRVHAPTTIAEGDETCSGRDVSDPRELFLTVYLLGPFRCFVNGRSIENWRSGKAKALFKYLVAHRRRSVGRDELMEALWPGGAPEASANSLRVAVHSLRQTLLTYAPTAIRQSCLAFEECGYRWQPDIHFWIDSEEFERHWESGRKFCGQGGSAEAIYEFEAAQKLYRGSLLDDDQLEEWTLLRREATRDKYLVVLTQLADRSYQLKDYEGAIAHSLKILDEDPCREDAYQRLIHIYLDTCQPSRARRWYQLCCATLRRELDMEPSLETRLALQGPSTAGNL